MHDSRIELNSGEVQVAPVWLWRPEEGYVQLIGQGPVRFTDIANGYIGGSGRRVLPDGRCVGTIEDIFARAIDGGWDGT